MRAHNQLCFLKPGYKKDANVAEVRQFRSRLVVSTTEPFPEVSRVCFCLTFPTTPFLKTSEPSSQDGEVTHRTLAPCGCHGPYRGVEMLGEQHCVLWEQHPGEHELSAINVGMPAVMRGTLRVLLLDVGQGTWGVLPQDERRRPNVYGRYD